MARTSEKGPGERESVGGHQGPRPDEDAQGVGTKAEMESSLRGSAEVLRPAGPHSLCPVLLLGGQDASVEPCVGSGMSPSAAAAERWLVLQSPQD